MAAVHRKESLSAAANTSMVTPAAPTCTSGLIPTRVSNRSPPSPAVALGYRADARRPPDCRRDRDLPVGVRQGGTVARPLGMGAADYPIKPCPATRLADRVRAALHVLAVNDPPVLSYSELRRRARRWRLTGSVRRGSARDKCSCSARIPSVLGGWYLAPCGAWSRAKFFSSGLPSLPYSVAGSWLTCGSGRSPGLALGSAPSRRWSLWCPLRRCFVTWARHWSTGAFSTGETSILATVTGTGGSR